MMHWKSITAAAVLSAGLVFAASSGVQAGAPMTLRAAAPEFAADAGLQLASHRYSYKKKLYRKRVRFCDRYPWRSHSNFVSRGCSGRVYYDEWGNRHCARRYARLRHAPFFFGFSWGHRFD